MGVMILLALAPLWTVGILGRGLWTPDEPREADIAWRMSLQQDRSLPQLAGTPFLEKPPLSYWMAGSAISVFGDTDEAPRVPNLLYALIAALSVGALALAMLDEVAPAVFAAVVSMSALLAFRVSVWLAPDAALLAGSAIALLGAWSGYTAAPGWRKAAGYTLMHLGAAIGFMAKSAPGWLVPALALATVIAWERRWSELRRWELYAGLVLQILLIGPWVLTVADSPMGAQALRALFWNNIMGRFTHVAAPPALDYTTGHQNWAGKYLLELPVYLLPWTLIAVAALARAATQLRGAAAAASAWRFALAACIPFLVVLSVAATARDVYAAPALIGFGLLAGLWLQCAQRAPDRLDRILLRLSRYLVLALAWALAAALAVFARAGASPPFESWLAAALIVTAAHLAMYLAARAQHANTLPLSVGWTYAGYAAALVIALLVAEPVIDRWQDLPQLVREIRFDTTQQPFALLDPDETTIAMLDHGRVTSFTILNSGGHPAAAVRAWFDSHGRNARLLVLLPGHAPGPLSAWLDGPATSGPKDLGIPAQLVAEGAAVLAHTYGLPQGRRYALLAPPG
jgi:4-amino-4-deoxy-L-arabinose transferase-like glycosyltransferase